MFALQIVVVLLLVVAAVSALVLQSERDSAQEARNRSLAVAQTFAASPGIVAALASPDPTALLQPAAEAARVGSGVDFVVVLNTEGIRYTHPNPDRIGHQFVGNYLPATQGNVVIERVNGTLGPLVQAVVPVYGPGHVVVGEVSAGITTSKVSGLANRQLPLVLAASAAALALATGGTALASRRLRHQTHGLGPEEMTRMYEHHDAVLHAVREGVLILDQDGRLLLVNDEARRLLALPPEAEGRPLDELGLPAAAVTLLAPGSEASDEMLASGERLLLVSVRPIGRGGGPPGSVATLRDSTELHAVSAAAVATQRRLRLLYEATMAVGTTLDISRTAEELAQVTVPGFADYVTVDLAESVLRGDEPGPGDSGRVRRTALGAVRPDPPFYPVGELISVVPATPWARTLDSGRPTLERDLRAATAWQAQDPARARRVLEAGVHSLLRVPLKARGVRLGTVMFWRAERPEAFDQDDLALAVQLGARAAVAIDNARRYAREHALATTLQRSLLPRRLPEQDALQVAYRYLPAQAGVSGDWFDVIPVPGARVALVVGDVVGHGLHAAATMGRLRTAVATFATLDLPPDELLGHLDDVVNRLELERGPVEDGDGAADGRDRGAVGGGGGEGAGVIGASCLIAVYDPVDRTCTIARAGHPPPVLVRPDGTAAFLDVPAGPPLGVGGLPFTAAEFELPEGSRLVLYTDGLVEDRRRDIDEGLERLRSALERADPDPEATCERVLATLMPPHQSDDIALLVARTRVLPEERVARWAVAADPAAVAGVRREVSRRLHDWGLAELDFATELILSELLTNAIRYATEPIQVRLLLDRVLVCEVWDGSSTAPHLRYAASTDEGGRGLFLVAQLAARWGTRYTKSGKVIWAEQELP
ncbi:histidine kinase [Streptomyces tateyamensis]|uniref:Histidine kinase n=1 Tax=Streptomyces tateyamensis TaxID=565073 RepID=A0A2V4PPN9_9ACTN|nr:SpoIIE family protein phosphatase/ATP-binding protein [Streptomyces tateyamensis]PYC88320.1 histidine kinase [Streptomyces tateyamensis]